MTGDSMYIIDGNEKGVTVACCNNIHDNLIDLAWGVRPGNNWAAGMRVRNQYCYVESFINLPVCTLGWISEARDYLGTTKPTFCATPGCITPDTVPTGDTAPNVFWQTMPPLPPATQGGIIMNASLPMAYNTIERNTIWDALNQTAAAIQVNNSLISNTYIGSNHLFGYSGPALYINPNAAPTTTLFANDWPSTAAASTLNGVQDTNIGAIAGAVSGTQSSLIIDPEELLTMNWGNDAAMVLTQGGSNADSSNAFVLTPASAGAVGTHYTYNKNPMTLTSGATYALSAVITNPGVTGSSLPYAQITTALNGGTTLANVNASGQVTSTGAAKSSCASFLATSVGPVYARYGTANATDTTAPITWSNLMLTEGGCPAPPYKAGPMIARNLGVIPSAAVAPQTVPYTATPNMLTDTEIAYPQANWTASDATMVVTPNVGFQGGNAFVFTPTAAGAVGSHNAYNNVPVWLVNGSQYTFSCVISALGISSGSPYCKLTTAASGGGTVLQTLTPTLAAGVPTVSYITFTFSGTTGNAYFNVGTANATSAGTTPILFSVPMVNLGGLIPYVPGPIADKTIGKLPTAILPTSALGYRQRDTGCSGTYASSGTYSFPLLGNPVTSSGCSVAASGGLGMLMATAGVLSNVTLRCTASGVNTSSGALTLFDSPSPNGSPVSTGITVTYGTTAAGTVVQNTSSTYNYSVGDIISARITTQASETLSSCQVSFTY